MNSIKIPKNVKTNIKRKDGEKMVLVFYLLSIIMMIISIILFFLFISRLEINVEGMYFNNIEKFRNNEKIKIKISLKILNLTCIYIKLDKKKIEKIYLKIKKLQANKNVYESQRKLKKQILLLLKNNKARNEVKNIKLNFENLKLDVQIANEEYQKTAYITTLVAIVISNILPYVVNMEDKRNVKNIYYKIKPVYINKNAYDILADFIINVKIYKMIFTLIRIKKETTGKNILKKKEGKNYGRTSNRKFNEHSYE